MERILVQNRVVLPSLYHHLFYLEFILEPVIPAVLILIVSQCFLVDGMARAVSTQPGKLKRLEMYLVSLFCTDTCTDARHVHM